MPEMDGPALLIKVRERLPDLKVIFVSGYAEESVRQDIADDQSVEFLRQALFARPDQFQGQGSAGRGQERQAPLTMAEHVLDNPAWHALDGPQAAIRRDLRSVPPLSLRCRVLRRHRDRGRPRTPRRLPAARHDHRVLDHRTLRGARRVSRSAGGGTGLQMVAEHYRSVKRDGRDARAGRRRCSARCLSSCALTQPGPFSARTDTLGTLSRRLRGRPADRDDRRAHEAARLHRSQRRLHSSRLSRPRSRQGADHRSHATPSSSAATSRCSTSSPTTRAPSPSTSRSASSLRRTLQVTLLRTRAATAFEEPDVSAEALGPRGLRDFPARTGRAFSSSHTASGIGQLRPLERLCDPLGLAHAADRRR